MSTNFLDEKHREGVRKDKKFGLCDNKDQTKAYTNLEHPSIWMATVINEKEKEVSFTPLDHNLLLYKPGTKDLESLCDGMLIYNDTLYFVELKDERTKWLPEAKEQLLSTIRLYNQYHDPSAFKHKKTFACNRHHKSFQTIEQEENLRYRREYGFRLDINGEIKIK